MSHLPSAAVLHHVVDVHCHPTDAPSIEPQSMDSLQITICAMATNKSDQQLVCDLATRYPKKVVPCFGYHPWFAHHISLHPMSKEDHYRTLFLISSTTTPEDAEAFERLLALLPDPTPLSDILSHLRSNFETFPNAMLGEVGLDRIFRVPYDYSASPRKLTPFTVPFDHQLTILEAQLDLAVSYSRNVSFHSVKSQLGTLELLNRMALRHGDKWHQISIDMHSCGLSAQMWIDIEKKYPNVFLSLSTVINGRSSNHKALIAACSSERILVESDMNDVDFCTGNTWDMLQTVAEIKGWSVEKKWDDNLDESDWGAVRKLEANWEAFQRGHHTQVVKEGNRKQRIKNKEAVANLNQ